MRKRALMVSVVLCFLAGAAWAARACPWGETFTRTPLPSAVTGMAGRTAGSRSGGIIVGPGGRWMVESDIAFLSKTSDRP